MTETATHRALKNRLLMQIDEIASVCGDMEIIATWNPIAGMKMKPMRASGRDLQPYRDRGYPRARGRSARPHFHEQRPHRSNSRVPQESRARPR